MDRTGKIRNPVTPREARMIAFDYMRHLNGGSGSVAYKKYEEKLKERYSEGLPLVIKNPTEGEVIRFRQYFYSHYNVRTWRMHGNLYIKIEDW